MWNAVVTIVTSTLSQMGLPESLRSARLGLSKPAAAPVFVLKGSLKTVEQMLGLDSQDQLV